MPSKAEIYAEKAKKVAADARKQVAETNRGLIEEQTGDSRFFKVGGGEFFKFEDAGDVVTGVYLGYTFTELKQGKETVSVPKYIVGQEDGAAPVEFLGNYALVEFFGRVPLGALVKVVYTGEKEKTASGFMVKKFIPMLGNGFELLAPVQTEVAQRALNSGEVGATPSGLVEKSTGEIVEMAHVNTDDSYATDYEKMGERLAA